MRGSGWYCWRSGSSPAPPRSRQWTLWCLIVAVPFSLWKRVLAETAAAFGIAFLWWVIVRCVAPFPTPPGSQASLQGLRRACSRAFGSSVGPDVSHAGSTAPLKPLRRPRVAGGDSPEGGGGWGWFVLGFAVVAGALAA